MAAASAGYGSFVWIQELELDGGAFGISVSEARSMDPQQTFVLHAGYAAVVSRELDDGLDRKTV